MPNYDSPTMSGIGFNFTTGGYSAPGMDEVEFRFGLRPSYQQTADLQAAINVLGLYQESTYTYLKSCPTYVVGYGSGGIQIIKAPCIYGGIRDLGAYIYGNPTSVDLSASITGKIPAVGLGAYIKATEQSQEDIRAYLKQTISSNRDLLAQVVGQLNKSIIDLYAYLQVVPPSDLSAYLNVIEQRDLPASIQGDLLKGQADLGGNIEKIFQRGYKDLNATIHSYATRDLPAYIGAVYLKDLSAFIQGSEYGDLSAYVFPVRPYDLGGNIHGYATLDLSASLVGGFGPGDLQAYITTIEPANLAAFVVGYRGVGIAYDLRAVVEGYFTSDLSAYIYANKGKDLPAHLNAVGKTIDLSAVIYPMVIHLKRMLSVSLLEHKDMWAVINASCFSSGYKDLSAYVYPLMKSDLRANIIGWKGGFADNLKDLQAYVNTSDYVVEDTLSVKTIPFNKNTQLKVGMSDISGATYNQFDTISIRFGSFYASDLSAYIYGMPEAKDLSASLNVLQQLPYREAPTYMKIKTREVVLNVTRFEPQWRRVAELFFDNLGGGDPFYYFYVQGENKIYKIDRNKHWIIRAVGYTRAPTGYNISRQKIWRKYVINMSSYASVDEAVRDLIDRVTFLRRRSLSAYINGVMPPHKDMSASIDVKSYYHWVYHLKAAIKILQRTPTDLNVEIIPAIPTGNGSLSASITGELVYSPSSSGTADFSFVSGDSGYVPPEEDDADYEFNV